jgi:predicted TIM-barrel fold metal-dependent hydrolase
MRPYIDCHNHIGRTLNRVPPTGQNTQTCLSRFAESDIYAAISMPTAVGSSIVRGLEDIRDQNNVISRACRDFPDRFPFGLALVEPRFGQYAVEEAERALDDPNLIGIVGHPPMKDEIYPMIEVAAARGGLCNLHWHDRLMDQTAQAFPNAQFIVHASTWAAENLAKYDNLWFEIVQYPDGRNSEWDFNWFADKVGRDRLIFGADLPYYDYRYLQRIIEAADIDDDLKDAIAQKNTVRLINHYRPDWQTPTDPITAPQQYDPEVLWTCEDDKPDRLTVLS